MFGLSFIATYTITSYIAGLLLMRFLEHKEPSSRHDLPFVFFLLAASPIAVWFMAYYILKTYGLHILPFFAKIVFGWKGN